MREGLLAELVLLELPEIPEVLIDVVPDRPVVVLALDWIRERLTLGVALNAHVVGAHIVQAGRVDNVVSRRVVSVGGAGAVAALATDVPLGNGVVIDVVPNRVATIAQRSRGPCRV